MLRFIALVDGVRIFFFDMYGHPSLHSVGSQDKFLVESDISQMIAPPLIPTSD